MSLSSSHANSIKASIDGRSENSHDLRLKDCCLNICRLTDVRECSFLGIKDKASPASHVATVFYAFQRQCEHKLGCS